MDAKSCWGVSIALHGILLLGAAVMAFDYFVLGDGEGSGFRCSLGDSTPRFATIERPKEVFVPRVPGAQGSAAAIEEIYALGGSRGMDLEPWPECCDCSCGGAATTIVRWPRDIAGYFDRKLSMATSRRGTPRLNVHGRACAFRDTGKESDCTCGLVPPRY